MAAMRNFLTTRKRRFAAALTLALLLAPGTFVRTTIPDRFEQSLDLAVVADLPENARVEGFTRAGVWELTSPNMMFGGYSALILSDAAQTARAFSDRGTMMTFALPGSASVSDVQFADIRDRGRLSSAVPDVEAATRDPETGDYWLAFENRHAVIRYSHGGGLEALREPPEWRGWPANSGAEAMARLPGGRFLVLPERSNYGLIYPSDPIRVGEPLRFTIAMPDDFAPTDLAALPDGRVLVLMRRVEWGWPPFTAALGIADPRELEEGDTLEVVQLLDLDALLPRENYEGLAVQPQADGSYALWIIADDNLASFQRTLLARLVWDGRAPVTHEKAREE